MEQTRENNQWEDTVMNKEYYINVKELMELTEPRCRLPRPKHKPTIIVNHDEWLPLVVV